MQLYDPSSPEVVPAQTDRSGVKTKMTFFVGDTVQVRGELPTYQVKSSPRGHGLYLSDGRYVRRASLQLVRRAETVKSARMPVRFTFEKGDRVLVGKGRTVYTVKRNPPGSKLVLTNGKKVFKRDLRYANTYYSQAASTKLVKEMAKVCPTPIVSAEVQAAAMPTTTVATQARIKEICEQLQQLLVTKNAAYGDSALSPLRVFSRADTVEQLKVRIDDKISRMSRGHALPDESMMDTIDDLMGYLVLLKIALQERAVLGKRL